MEITYCDGVFSVDGTHGFLPMKDPLAKLPDNFSRLQEIVDNMPIYLEDGTNGYLFYEGRIHEECKSLPNHVNDIAEVKDPFVLQALFRSYAFLASAYLLEPSYHHFLRTGDYGPALRVLPANIAMPFASVANVLGIYPFMDYHYGYSLCNYVRIDPDKDLDWTNLKMAGKFSGTPDETGFIMVHVDINQHSPQLVSSVFNTLQGLKDGSLELVRDGLTQNWETMKVINERRKKMWQASRHKHYNDFRVFIMGIKGNTDMFGDGVVYEGVSDEPMQYRGQTGAQDDIIPTEDIFCGLIKYYPENKLTDYLLDLRQYRPVVVQRFFRDLQTNADGIFEKVVALDKSLLVPLLGIVDEIYKFRNGHWQFVQKYIMANTKYDRATGGTPITTWIPNQIEACLKYTRTILDTLKTDSSLYSDEFVQYMEGRYTDRVRILHNQIEELKTKNFDAGLIYRLNESEAEY